MYYIGLDISLTSTGVAVMDESGFVVETMAICTDQKSHPSKDLEGRIKRYQFIASHIENCVLAFSPCKIMIEGYSAGSVGYGQRERHELGGVVRDRIVGCGNSVEEIPPQSLKKRVTGSGKGGGKEGKERMRLAINKFFGYDLGLKTDDEYDAVGLCLCAGGWL